MNYDKIGKFILTLRKKKELTQKDLANYLNITDRAVSKWERGKGCPDVSLLEDLSKILDVSIIELLKGERIKDKQKLKKEELLYSMNYAKRSTKEKIYKIINTVIITLVSVIILIIVFNNLKIGILFNYHYYSNIVYIDVDGTDNKKMFSNIEEKIELIQNENVNSLNEELEQIINIIKNDFDEEQIIYNKDYYTFDEIKRMVYRESNGVNDIIKLVGYNMSYKNIALNNDIMTYVDSYNDYEKKLKYFIDNCYRYNYSYDYNMEESIGAQVKQYLYNKYNMYSLVLDNLIKDGEIGE